MSTKPKYVIVKSSNIIVQIAKQTEIKGYTEGVLEIFFPDDDVLAKMTEKEKSKWIGENNNRMNAICGFLNKNNL